MGNQVHFYTLEEAVEAGIPYQEQSEFACEYCAKPLEQLGILGCDGVVRWVIRKECGCEAAREHREATKRKEELIERKEQESRFLRAGIAKRYLCASVSNSESVRYIESFRVGIGAGLYFVGVSALARPMRQARSQSPSYGRDIRSSSRRPSRCLTPSGKATTARGMRALPNSLEPICSFSTTWARKAPTAGC